MRASVCVQNVMLYRHMCLCLCLCLVPYLFLFLCLCVKAPCTQALLEFSPRISPTLCSQHPGMYAHSWVSVCVRSNMCVCVCVKERERKKDPARTTCAVQTSRFIHTNTIHTYTYDLYLCNCLRTCMNCYMCVRTYINADLLSAQVSIYMRKSICVCMCVRDVCVRVCVCVCARGPTYRYNIGAVECGVSWCAQRLWWYSAGLITLLRKHW